MKKIQIKKALLAAAMLAGVGIAYGGESQSINVVYCKVELQSPYNDLENMISVTLPPTEGYYDYGGNPITYWNVGRVPYGGVADSWHAEGGPGRFTAKNAGTRGAYLYVSTGDEYQRLMASQYGDYRPGTTNYLSYVYHEQFGKIFDHLRYPCVSPSELRLCGLADAYHLAFTTDVTAKVPTWHSLDHRCMGGSEYLSAKQYPDMQPSSGNQVVGYMGFLDPGDYLMFDLKFWAPVIERVEESYLFTFCVEASEFPLWDHGRAVE